MYNQAVCKCAFNVCLCMHAVFVTHSMHNNACACDGMDLCVLTCVFMRERETTNNTVLTKIQRRAFVKVTPIHLAWQQSLYLFSYSHMSFPLHCFALWLRYVCV